MTASLLRKSIRIGWPGQLVVRVRAANWRLLDNLRCSLDNIYMRRGVRSTWRLVPKLHLGTPLSAQFYCSAQVLGSGMAEDRQWSCLSKCVPKWDEGNSGLFSVGQTGLKTLAHGLSIEIGQHFHAGHALGFASHRFLPFAGFSYSVKGFGLRLHKQARTD